MFHQIRLPIAMGFVLFPPLEICLSPLTSVGGSLTLYLLMASWWVFPAEVGVGCRGLVIFVGLLLFLILGGGKVAYL